MFLDACERHGERVALEDTEGAWTYGQVRLLAMAAGAAARRALGARLGILLPPCKAYGACLFGVQLAGKVPVLLNPLLTPGELQTICSDAGVFCAVRPTGIEASSSRSGCSSGADDEGGPVGGGEDAGGGSRGGGAGTARSGIDRLDGVWE